jgi:hypothetical protein
MCSFFINLWKFNFYFNTILNILLLTNLYSYTVDFRHKFLHMSALRSLSGSHVNIKISISYVHVYAIGT